MTTMHKLPKKSRTFFKVLAEEHQLLANKKKKIRVIREIRAKKKEKSVNPNNDNKESLTP